MTKDDLTRLHERIDAVFEAIGGLREDVTAVITILPRQDEAIQELRTTLHGPPENGHNPGIVGRVADLEAWRRVVRIGLYGLWTVAIGAGAIGLESLLRQAVGG
jgi:hypothetical protein